MKKTIFTVISLAILAVTFLIAGCGPIYKTTYTYVPPKSYRARMCLNQCLSAKSQCAINCRMINQRCHANADYAAEPAYRTYMRQQRRQGKPALASLGSFADYSGCQANCSCAADYRQCYTNCGGKVIADTVCTAFCKKAKQ
jgi:hypothetical protein